MSDIIAGIQVGPVAITVADGGVAVTIGMSGRHLGNIEATLSVPQCARLRRLLAAAEKRASAFGRTPSATAGGE